MPTMRGTELRTAWRITKTQKFAVCTFLSFTASVFFTQLSLSLCFWPTGNYKGMCRQIDHFPEDTDYEADPSEYFLREYPFSRVPLRRASVTGVCVCVCAQDDLLLFFFVFCVCVFVSVLSHLCSVSVWSAVPVSAVGPCVSLRCSCF